MPTVIRVVDFETCGIGPPAEVIEVGLCDVVLLDGATVIEFPEARLYGAAAIPAETRAIHHIAPADVAGLPRFDPRVLVEDARVDGVFALAAHHADFESRWLEPVLGELPVLCTYKAALRLWPQAPNHSNQTLRYWLPEQGFGELNEAMATPAHRAGPDAYASAFLLRAILSLATIGQVLAWTKEPALMLTIPIGNQRGAKWADVDESFLTWMLRTADMDPDLKWNASREIKRRHLESETGT